MKKDQLVSKIRKEFPEIVFKKVELVTSGWVNDVLILDNKLIFRFIKKKSDKKSFIREVKFLKEFSKVSNLKVPKYIFLSKDNSFGGYEMIQGKALTPQIYKKLSIKQKQKIIKDLAQFINILHSIPLKKAREYGFENYRSWKQEIKDKEKWYKEKFEKKVSKKLTLKENAYIKKFVAAHYRSQYSVNPVLGHNDLSHDHVIMNKDKSIAGILDFGDIALSDPAHEFNGFFDYDPKMPLQIYKLYTGPKDKNFFKRAEEHFIHRWIYLIYAGLFRAKDKTLYKEARKRLQSFIQENKI